MLKDKFENLERYYPLDENLRSLKEKLEVPVYYGFVEDRSKSTLFVVKEGTLSAATSWRENKDSRETIALMTLKEDEFVLYLPGEPMLVKAGDDSIIEMYKA